MASLTLQSSFTGGELSPSLSARIDFPKYAHGCRELTNFRVQPHGGAVKRPGFLYLDTIPGEAHFIPFIFNSSQAYALAFGEKWMRVYTPNGAVVKDGSVYQIATPYTLAQAKKISFVQSADVLFLACEGVAPQQLKRFGHNSWAFEGISFASPVTPPGAPTVTGASGSTQYAYYVTTINGAGQESELSPPTYHSGPPSNNWTSGAQITISWGAVSGASEYKLYKSSFGGRPGFIAYVSASSRTYQDINVSPSLDEGAPKYTNPFSGGDYPRTVAFYEGRLVFASTPRRPQTIWMSKNDDYLNFAVYSPQTADSPWEGTVRSQHMAPIVWLVALRSLVLGSTMAEWEISSTGGAFSTGTAQVRPQSYNGSDWLPAIIIGDAILHVARNGAQIRDLKYEFSADAYGGTDRSILATHLFDGKRILDWTYQQHPDSIVWLVRSDGKLLGLTYQAEHEVIAWHKHETDGAFLAVTSIPQTYDDHLFAVVRRVINGQTKYFVERLAENYTGGDYASACYLDSAKVYNGNPVTKITGLNHLEGKTVGILAGGAVMATRKVVGGAVTLDHSAGKVIVGLPYTASLETMPLDYTTKAGATVGRKKQVKAVNVRLQNSADLTIGLNCDGQRTTPEELKMRTNEKFGEGIEPFSGDRRAIMDSRSATVVTVRLESASPTPLTALAIMPEVEMQ